MRAHRTWRNTLRAARVASLFAMVFLTVKVVGQDWSHSRAEARSDQLTELRLALWQMDSVLTPILAREAARAPGEYACPTSDGRATSALIDFESDLIPLHFQWARSEGIELCSPVQAVEGPDPSSDTGDDPERARLLARVRGTALAELQSRFEAMEAQQDRWSRPDPELVAALPNAAQEDLLRNQIELSQRANFQRSYNAPSPSWTAVQSDPEVLSGLRGIWIDEEQDPLLICIREVQSNGLTLQGFSFDWEELRELLLEQADEIDVTVRPLLAEDDPAAQEGNVLSALPIAVDLNERDIDPSLSGNARFTLLVAWLAAIGAWAAFELTIRKSLDYADKRSRFASTVTHELRTPLTTFRMYSEMLAKDMVAEDQRGEYLETLERESERLSHLVENVLAYARIEEGRGEVKAETLSAGELLERVLPVLEAHCEKEGMALDAARSGDDAPLLTDPRAVEQILFNLVDNACKYGRGEDDQLELRLKSEPSHVVFEVTDRGPGVPKSHARAIFEAFDRGSRDEADPSPGVGLGLGLARELARALGGTLTLVPGRERGACFRLSLPRKMGSA